MKYNIGDRVRCTNPTSYHDKIGTIESIGTGDYPYRIKWDHLSEPVGGNNHGGPWSDRAFELAEERQPKSDREIRLEEAVRYAQKVFEGYAEDHTLKGTVKGDFRARINDVHAVVMAEALDED